MHTLPHPVPHGRPLRGPLEWHDWILIGLAVATIVLGYIGFGEPPVHEDVACTHAHDFAGHSFDRLYRSLLLFEIDEGNLDIGVCYENLEVEVARWLGMTALVWAIVRVFWVIFAKHLRRIWMRVRWQGHAIVVGLGAKGRVRATELAGSGVRVAALEPDPDEAAYAFARSHSIVLVAGDGRDAASLRRVRASRAAQFIVATGDDSRNLAIGRMLAALPREPTQPPRSVAVSLDEPLIRRSLTAGDSDAVIEPFALDELIAHAFCHLARLPEIADLRGQTQVHAVFIGFGAYGPALVAQILRTSLMADHSPTRITVLASDPEAARASLRLRYPEATSAGAFSFLVFDATHQPLDDGTVMADVATQSAITAVVVPPDRGAAPLVIAIAAREAMRRSGQWSAPVFFASDSRAGLDQVAVPIEQARRYGDVLQPFDISAQLCAQREMTERDAVARAVHESYLHWHEVVRREKLVPSISKHAFVPWSSLPLTYRQASRRSADQLAAMLLSAGCMLPRGKPVVATDFDLLADPPMLERLSRLEHDAWTIDRHLEGWRSGSVRDDARLIHDCLVPFEKLTGEFQELERAQIRSLNSGWLPRGTADSRPSDLVRFDLWIGVIGTRRLSSVQALQLVEAISAKVIPGILACHPRHHVTLLTPLAPGADLIATRAALAALESAGITHRLLIIEAAPAHQVIEDFKGCWQSGAAADSASLEAAAWPDARRRIAKAVKQIRKSPVCARVVELDRLAEGADEDSRIAAYRRQNAFLVQRSHVLIASTCGRDQSKPGGTREAIAWRRDPASIPAEQQRYLRRPNRADPAQPGLIVIDLESHNISSER